MKKVQVELVRYHGAVKDYHPSSDSLTLVLAVPQQCNEEKVRSLLAEHYTGDQTNHIPIDIEVIEYSDGNVVGTINESGEVVCNNHNWVPQQY